MDEDEEEQNGGKVTVYVEEAQIESSSQPIITEIDTSAIEGSKDTTDAIN